MKKVPHLIISKTWWENDSTRFVIVKKLALYDSKNLIVLIFVVYPFVPTVKVQVVGSLIRRKPT